MYQGLVFSLLSYLVAVPSAVKIFNWTATIFKGSVRFQTPFIYALGMSTQGFTAATLFADGHAEFNDGEGWKGWEQWGQKNRLDSDLQFYFNLSKN